MFALLLAVSTSTASAEPPPEPYFREVRAPVTAASFGGALLGGAASITAGLLMEEGLVVATTLPVAVLAGAAIPTALMTDGRAGYVTLGAGVGMAGGWLVGMAGGAAMGSLLQPSDGFAPIIGAGIGGVILGTLGAATGSLVAAHWDIGEQHKKRWALSPTYLLEDNAPGIVFSGRF